MDRMSTSSPPTSSSSRQRRHQQYRSSTNTNGGGQQYAAAHQQHESRMPPPSLAASTALIAAAASNTSCTTTSTATTSSSNDNNSVVSSMDCEAFRRVGRRLSERVLENNAPVCNNSVSLTAHVSSAFEIPKRRQAQHVGMLLSSDGEPNSTEECEMQETGEKHVFDRTFKVAKTGYADHGDHHLTPDDPSSLPRRRRRNSQSLLLKLTQHARDTYERARPEDVLQHKKKSPCGNNSGSSSSSCSRSSATVSPHRQALSQLALEDTPEQQAETTTKLPATTAAQQQQQVDSAIAPSSQGTKGLLQAALEGEASSLQQQQQQPIQQSQQQQQQQSPSTAASSQPLQHRHNSSDCLTQPSEPVSNDGLDNAEGNLIVHRGDVLSVPPDQLHTFASSAPRRAFWIDRPLGQGTFAQVFECTCRHTHERVALKIVKNRPAYTKQAAVEIDVFRALRDSHVLEKDHMVRLQCYFMYHSHLCLVFELLGLNLYEVLKKRQFRGLPLSTVRGLMQQAMEGIKDLSQKSIVHCDLKPENILLCSEEDVAAVVNVGERVLPVTASGGDVKKSGTPVTDDTGRPSSEPSSGPSSVTNAQSIKLIDFGSACFEGHTAHTYIQSRFYRSPEVLIGLSYDSAIDMWSLGCVAAELFLGLPILPGMHEHDQLGRISEMIGPIPDWMLEQGSKSPKYFVKQFQRPAEDSPKQASRAEDDSAGTPSPGMGPSSSHSPTKISWRFKTLKEYIKDLSSSELKKKGGLAKLEKQASNPYFKRKRLADIIMLHGQSEDREALGLFVHFLLGVLDPDPWKRWTAYQASMHPFLTGTVSHRRRQGANDITIMGAKENSNREFDIYWVPPWDPSICRRKLLNVQKMREKQQALRRRVPGQERSPGEKGETSPQRHAQRRGEPASPSVSAESSAPDTSDPKQIRRQTSLPSRSGHMSPPLSVASVSTATARTAVTVQSSLPQQHMVGSVGGASTATNVGGMMMNNPYVAASSLTDHHPMNVDSQMPAMFTTSNVGYEVPVPQPMHVFSGPQSFHGISHEGLHHMPVEGDFGYALQRPGVFPGMGGDLSGSFTMNQPMPAMGYSPYQLVSPGGSYAYSTSAGYAPMSARRRHTHHYPNGGLSHSYGPGAFLTSPTSIREDATDINLGPSDAASMQTSSHGSTASLLAQQLEANSSLQMPHDSPMQDMMHSSDSQLQAHPRQYVGPGAGAMMYAPSGHPYYTTFLATNGAGMMSSPTNADMVMNSAMSYGSYTTDPRQVYYHQYGAPNAFAPPQAYPSYLVQPSLDDTQGNRNGSEAAGITRARPPPKHQGMSM